MDIFSSREIATAVWLFLFFAFAARSAGVSRLGGVLRSFVNRHILGGLSAMLVYTTGVVYGLRVLGFWNVGLLKDTIVWFCFTAFALTVTAVLDQHESIFRRALRETIKWMLVFEFLINEYTFALPVELVLVPLMAVVVTLDVVARGNTQYLPVAKLTGGVQAFAGLFLVINAVNRAVEGFDKLTSLDAAREFLLAPTLTLSFLPFLFLAILYSSYEQLFVRLKLGPPKEPREVRAIKHRLVLYFGFNVTAIRRFNKAHAWDLSCVRTAAELITLLGTWRTVDHTKDPLLA